MLGNDKTRGLLEEGASWQMAEQVDDDNRGSGPLKVWHVSTLELTPVLRYVGSEGDSDSIKKILTRFTLK